MVDAVSRAYGAIDGSGDVDVFRVDAVAGERYVFELLVGRLFDGSTRFYQVALVEPGGAERLLAIGAVDAGRDELRTFSVSPAASGPLLLRLSADGGRVDYALQALQVAADDHAGHAAAATRLAIGSRVAGVFERPGDEDVFAVDLLAGQHLRLDIVGTAARGSRLDFSASLRGPDGGALPWSARALLSDAALGFVAPTAGRYTLLLRAGSSGGADSGSPGSYTVLATLPPADDHADVPERATPLRTGAAPLDVLVDHAGDLDWFAIELVAGERIVLALAGGDGGLPGLALFDPAGQPVRSSDALSLVHEAAQGGRYTLRVGLSEGARQFFGGASERFALKASAAPADDTGGEPRTAATLLPGSPVAGSFFADGDQDVFRFDAVPGQRHEVVLSGSFFLPGWIDVETALPVTAALRDFLHPGSAGDGPLRLVIPGDIDGPVWLRLQPPGGVALPAAYQLSLRTIPADDHGETRASATPLRPGEPQQALLEPGENDVFRVELQAGQRYAFEVRPLDAGAAATTARMALHDASDAAPLASAGEGGRLHVVAPASAAYYLALQGQGERVELVLRPLPPDDAGDDAASALPLQPGAAPVGLGLSIDGSTGPDRLAGSARDDHLRGHAGNDQLRSGGGSDRIDGGAGIDTLWLDGTRAEHALARDAAGGWRIVRGAQAIDAVGVERLQFAASGSALALDLDGHAGQVARIIGALFGKAVLADAPLVGIGLALLDAGVPYAELVAAALATPLFAQAAGSRSDADFVRHVYRNLTGQLPGETELALYTGLLASGAATQASLALLACDSALNAAQIDLAGLAATGLAYVAWSG